MSEHTTIKMCGICGQDNRPCACDFHSSQLQEPDVAGDETWRKLYLKAVEERDDHFVTIRCLTQKLAAATAKAAAYTTAATAAADAYLVAADAAYDAYVTAHKVSLESK